MVLAKWDVQQNGSNSGNLIPVFSLSQYLTQDCQLSIPPWQREYTWDAVSDDGEVSQLMSDLVMFVDSSASEYLLGAVILCDTDDRNVKYIIDGQQRTVTLTLFLMCAFKHLTQELGDLTDHNLLTRIETCFNKGSHFHPQPSVLFTQQRADRIMQQIRAWILLSGEEADKQLRETETYSQTQKNLLAVVRYFSRGLRDETWFSNVTLKQSLWKILDGTKLLQLNLDNQRDAIRVYDRINNRGRHLSGGDLVKNIMFEQVEDLSFDEINANWIAAVETLRHLDSTKMQEPTFLLRLLAWGYRQGKTTYDELPEFFANHFQSGGKENRQVNPIEFSATLVDAAESLSEFANLRHRQHGDLPLLKVPQWLGTVQHYAVLLAGEGIRKKDAFLELYMQVATRTALYVFAQERTPDFETLVSDWAHAIYLAGNEATVDEIKSIFEKHVGYPEVIVEQMKVNASGWTYQKSAERKRIRASLSMMSWWIDTKAQDNSASIDEYFRTRRRRGEKAGWDVDHIEAQGCDVLGMNDEQKNQFGNLVLLHPSDNRGSRNATASTKKAAYEQSRLVLTKSLAAGNYPNRIQRTITDHIGAAEGLPTVEEWGAESVERRTALYVQLLARIITRSG